LDIYAIYIFICGLCLGSYYNVVAIRGLRKDSIFTGRSECMTCHTQIKAYDLIPVFSYFILRGKCRKCKSSFSPDYILGELLTGIVFLAMYLRFGLTGELIIALVFSSVLILAVLTDIRERLILDIVTLPSMLLLLVLELIINPDHFLQSVLGGFAIVVGLEMINFFKKDAIGGGDIKLFGVVGIVLGIKLTLMTLFIAALVGIVAFLPLYLLKKRDNTLAFAPCIAIAALFSYCFSDLVLSIIS